MQANDVFLIELYVSLADRSLYSSNKLQVNFSKNKIRQKSDLILEDARNYIDCNSNEYFGDKTWHKVQGRYVAKGGERFITIGLFEPNFNYKERTQKNGLPYIYHYIDNISLVKLNDIDKYR